MPDRRWIIDPALVITLLLCCGLFMFVAVDVAYLKAKQYIAEQSKGAADANDAKKKIEQTCGSLDGLEWRECALESVQPSRQQSQDSRDLHAQEWMARWAFWMFLASSATVVITGFGVWFVKRTLDATLKAVGETSAATDAMRESNRIMRDGQRPWIDFYISADYDFEVVRGTGGQEIAKIEPAVKIRNFGQSPAKNVFIKFFPISTTTFYAQDIIGLAEKNLAQRMTSDFSVFPTSGQEWETIVNVWGSHSTVDFREYKPIGGSLSQGTRLIWAVAVCTYSFGDKWFYTAKAFRNGGGSRKTRGLAGRGFYT